MWASLTSERAESLARELGTPYYWYDSAILRARARRVKACADQLLYAVKANPHPEVLGVLRPHVDGLDVASLGEIDAALAAGFTADQLNFAGPGKSATALERAVKLGVLISLESLRELELINSFDVTVRVRLRVNPKTTFRSYRLPFTGTPSVFGFDEESLDDVLRAVKQSPRVELVGLHLHPGAQCTSLGGVTAALATGLTLLEQTGTWSLNLGGGFGAIAPGLELDVDALAVKTKSLLEKFAVKTGRRASLTIEPGRFIAGPAGLYVTRVVSEKQSRGSHFTVLDGGIHHFFSASSLVAPANAARAPVLNLSRPDAPMVKRSLAGVLCTPLDSFGELDVPEPRIGELIAFQGAGAYGPTFSPLGFLSHARPAESIS